MAQVFRLNAPAGPEYALFQVGAEEVRFRRFEFYTGPLLEERVTDKDKARAKFQAMLASGWTQRDQEEDRMTPTHGGRREGAGRPVHKHPQSLIRIEASEAEQQEIQAWLTPRQRTTALLDAAAVVRLRKVEDDGT